MARSADSLPLTEAATDEVATPVRWRTWHSLRRSRLAVPALVVIAGLAVCALFANVLAPYDPGFQNYSSVLQSPSLRHLLGTDEIGRDVLSRIIHGSRISISVGLVAVGIALAIGVTLGLGAAYLGGWLDDAAMRVMDAVAAFPALVLALGIAAVLGPGLLNVMVAIGVVYTPLFARLARAEALSVRERDFVLAARSVGTRPVPLITTHIWPNVTAPIIVLASLRVASAILTEAALSFLGVGVPLGTPSWGAMLRSSYQYTETAPWLAVFPGVAIFLTVLAINLFGDGLRSALDPRMRVRA